MKKSIIKKIFIKLCKIMGYEIIDQNNFVSPTLNRELNDNLSILNDKSIILPLGEVKISRKISSVLILFRTNSNVEIWKKKKKRLFEEPKIEYSIRSINSLIKSINHCQNELLRLNIKTIIIDDNSKIENLNKVRNLIKNENC